MQRPTSRRKFLVTAAPGLMGRQGERENKNSNVDWQSIPSPSHSAKREAGSITLPVSANRCCRDGERGWPGSTSSSRCSLGCCWFNKCCLVFDWIPLSEVTCFLSQIWYLTVTFCLLPLVLNPGKYIPGLPRWLIGEESTCPCGCQSPSQEDPLEKEMAPYSSILAREIPWTEESGKLQSLGL